MPGCTPVMSFESFRTASLSMPLQRQHLKISQNLIVYSTEQEGTDDSRYYTPPAEFSVNKVISPRYIKDPFLDTFGPVIYVLEGYRINLSEFLFVKHFFDFVVIILRYMEINKMTGFIIGFSKTLLSVSYYIFWQIFNFPCRKLVLQH